MVVAAALLGACGDDPATEPPAQATTTSIAPRTYSADLTTSDGYRYTITLAVGPRSLPGLVDECPATPATGTYLLPVSLTVANAAADRPAPFPPLRVELATSPGIRPGQVMLKDTAGSCTFTPRAPSIGPGASLVFRGTSPAIADGAAPGTAGRIEVKVSESAFSLAAPVP